MRTKFTKNVSFLQPFLKGLGKIVPTRKLSHIRGYRVAKGLNEQAQASIIRHSRNRYTINIRIQDLIDNSRTHAYKTVEQILLDLAHELAHLKEWHHTPKHFEIQGKLLLIFAGRLEQAGIKDHSKRLNKLRNKNGKAIKR